MKLGGSSGGGSGSGGSSDENKRLGRFHGRDSGKYSLSFQAATLKSIEIDRSQLVSKDWQWRVDCVPSVLRTISEGNQYPIKA